MTADVDIVVIGAGAVGLAIAASLARRGRGVLVLEKNNQIGAETSSRNSEVIHAGLYYPPGSLKARLCVEGKERLYAFANENGITIDRCGKLVVATSDDEVPRLEQLAATAAANGVPDLKRLSASDARRLEPELACVAAYLSPSSGIIDSHGLMQALDGHIASYGGEVVLGAGVTGLRVSPDQSFVLEVSSGGSTSQITAANLIIAAGHGASKLANFLRVRDGYKVPKTYLAKGHYFALTSRTPFRRLVYPLPWRGSLGLHFSIDIAGQAKFGPDIEWVDRFDYTFDNPNNERLELFEREIRRYWPGLPDHALAPGYTGIRPKLTPEGQPQADFAIHGPSRHGVPRCIALFGIDSPGLTSSLAIGEYVAEMVS